MSRRIVLGGAEYDYDDPPTPPPSTWASIAKLSAGVILAVLGVCFLVGWRIAWGLFMLCLNIFLALFGIRPISTYTETTEISVWEE